MTTTTSHDVVVVGGGHNGLTAAAYLARAGRYHVLEGADRARHVVARFPSLDAAVACYHSTEYQAALAHAKGASERDLVIVEEAAPPTE